MTRRTLTRTTARRLAIARQHLAGDPPPATAEGILQVVRDLGCLQLDPISAVARSHLLVLWSSARRLRPRRSGSAGLRGSAVVRVFGARRLDCADRGLPHPSLVDAPLRAALGRGYLGAAGARVDDAKSGVARLHPHRAARERGAVLAPDRSRRNSILGHGNRAVGPTGAASAGCWISSGRMARSWWRIVRVSRSSGI